MKSAMELKSNITPLSLLVALSHLRMIDFFAVISSFFLFSFLFPFFFSLVICTSLLAQSLGPPTSKEPVDCFPTPTDLRGLLYVIV